MALYLREQDVEKLVNMRDALQVVEAAFRRYGEGAAVNRPRTRLRIARATLHLMSAGLSDPPMVGCKVYLSGRGKTRFHVLLYHAETGDLLAMIEADRLGQMRTGATSGVATKYMARESAAVAGLFGTGWQAEGQAEAVSAVRKLQRIVVYGRDPERRRTFCTKMADRLAVEVVPSTNPQDVVQQAEILITATSSVEPVFSGEWLQPGTHINAVGSNYLVKRELDEEAVRRCHRIVVDSREQAERECGDLLGPIDKGILHWSQVHELGQVIVRRVLGRGGEEEITLFESHGLALEDISLAALIYQRAVTSKVGDPLPF